MRVTEIELSSVLNDQPRHDGLPRRKLLILAPPRCGSYMLCRMLLAAGIGVPHEYFNDIHLRMIGDRLGVPGAATLPSRGADPKILLRYLHALFAHRTRNGLFAAKIQYSQFERHLANPVGSSLFDGAALVYLTRRDRVAQAVSLHFAELTGRWSFETARITTPQLLRQFYDAVAINDALTRLETEECAWENFFAHLGKRPLRIAFEDLVADPAGHLLRIAQACGVAPNRLTMGYDDQGSYPPEPMQPSKEAVVKFFLAARDAGPTRLTATAPPPHSARARPSAPLP